MGKIMINDREYSGAADSTLFTSGDNSSAAIWTPVNTIASNEPHPSLFNKISTMVKNVRFLYNKLGETDVSNIGTGTITNAIYTVNNNFKANEYKDITADFDDGTFSANLFKYNTGNCIKKTYEGVTYVAVLADYNTFYNPERNDYANINRNHWTAIILGFPAGQMNSTDTTENGFKGSAMNTWLQGNATTIIKNAFGTSHLLSHSCFLSNGTYNNTSITHGFGWEWVSDIFLMLMSEAQVYGTAVWSDLGWSTGEAYKQLEIFKKESIMSVLGQNYGQSNNNFNQNDCWLRDISVGSLETSFCGASCSASAGYASASISLGRFPIGIFY